MKGNGREGNRKEGDGRICWKKKMIGARVRLRRVESSPRPSQQGHLRNNPKPTHCHYVCIYFYQVQTHARPDRNGLLGRLDSHLNHQIYKIGCSKSLMALAFPSGSFIWIVTLRKQLFRNLYVGNFASEIKLREIKLVCTHTERNSMVNSSTQHQ